MTSRLLKTVQQVEEEAANAIYFSADNGSYLHLTSNAGASSKQMLFSLWFRIDSNIPEPYFLTAYNGSGAKIVFKARVISGKFYFLAHNSAGTQFYVQPGDTTTKLRAAKWHHILLSVDTALSKSEMYINDILQTTSPTISNDTIAFLDTTILGFVSNIGATQNGTCSTQHCYFNAGEYLDLSIESNRRKFSEFNTEGQLVPVDLGADGSTPTGTQPEIYCPLDDLTAPGKNLGTLSDFTENGAFELASTAPVDPSVEALYANGVDSGMVSPAGILTSSDKFTASFWFNPSLAFQASSLGRLFERQTDRHIQWAFISSSTDMVINNSNAAGAAIANWTLTTAELKHDWNHILISVDATAGKRELYINDVLTSVTPTGISGTMNFNGTYDIFSRTSASLFLEALLSEFLFKSGSYLDLSIESNRRLFINADLTPANTRQLDTASGLSPEIYLPHAAQQAGVNEGSAGDFTVNGAIKNALSTPLYYYANPALFDGTNDYLNKVDGTLDGDKLTFSFWVKHTFSILAYVFSGGAAKFEVNFTSSGTMRIEVRDSSLVRIIRFDILSIPEGEGVNVTVSLNSTTQTIQAYLNGVAASTNIVDNVVGTMRLTETDFNIGARDSGGSNKIAMEISELFIAYDVEVDLAANIAQFITADGRPAGNLIETTGLTPEIYLANPFDSFENNLGSGGDFTVNGALTNGTNSPSDKKEVV